nr:tetratricopeptide repeat protein [Shimazuella soli]
MDHTKLRELFRSIRKEKKLKQRDLEEKGISATTVSNFEHGRKNVSMDKIYRLFEKIGVNKQDLPLLLREEKQRERDALTLLKLDLKAIETEMDCGDYKKAMQAVKILQLPTDHPYTAVTEYLKGKYYYKGQNWQKAHLHFLRAIQMVDDYPEIQATNIKAASYYELARIAYRLNKLDNTVQCVENGLEAFDSSGERKFLIYSLLLSKAIYLEKLDRDNEAMKILDEMWPHLNEIDTEIQLNMYDLQAKLYNKHQMYDKAIRYASEGIDIARREKKYDRCFELWTTLGTSYNHLGEYQMAMKCFQTASSLEGKIQRKFLSATNHYQLGLLYFEEGDIDRAEETLRKALKISKEENDVLNLCESHLGLAKCKRKQNMTSEAIQHYEQALQIAEQHSFRTQQRDIALELTKFYEHKNSKEHFKYMTIFYQNSLLLNGGDPKMTTKLQPLTTERIFEADPPDI